MKKLLTTALFVVTSCSSSPPKLPDTKPTTTQAASLPAPEQWKRCLTGVSGLTSDLDPERRLELVVLSCFDACRPSEQDSLKNISKWEKGDVQYEEVVAKCNLFCSEEAKAAKLPDGSVNWREVSRLCGGDYYRLPAGQESLLTQDWAAFFRVAEHVGLSYQYAKQQNSEALTSATERVFESFWVPMSMPAFVEGQYRLPTASSNISALDTFVPITERLYVRVNKGRYFVGATPVVKLEPNGFSWVEIPGLSWPSDISLEKLAAKFPEYEATWEKTLKISPAKPTSLPEMVTSAPSAGGSNPTTAPRKNPASEPGDILYTADASSPVSWLTQAVQALPGRIFRLAVAHQGKAVKHVASLSSGDSPTSLLAIKLNLSTCEVSTTSASPKAVPKNGTTCDLVALRSELITVRAANAGFPMSLSLSIPANLALSELVKVLDLSSNLGITHVQLAANISPSSTPTSQPTNP